MAQREKREQRENAAPATRCLDRPYSYNDGLLRHLEMQYSRCSEKETLNTKESNSKHYKVWHFRDSRQAKRSVIKFPEDCLLKAPGSATIAGKLGEYLRRLGEAGAHRLCFVVYEVVERV